jgi:coenzyme F420-0:L-glutamate ligase/coenzyme F420-1:gamma-L-glutamate ligase
MPPEIYIIGITGIPEVQQGDNIGTLLLDAAQEQGTCIESGDIIVVTQKIVSKAEGRVVHLSDIEPTPLALSISENHTRDPRHTELILRESKRVVRLDRGVIISETHHGFICANAGIDASNVPGVDTVALLPLDPDATARDIRQLVMDRLVATVAVIITDTFGRPWRMAAINVAIGSAGVDPLLNYVGHQDDYGNPIRTTVIAVADELAAAAELVTGKVRQVPVAIIKGYPFQSNENATCQSLIRPPEKDLFR